MTLTQTAQLMSVKDNAVLPALRVALDALAAHYGLAYSGPRQDVQRRRRATDPSVPGVRVRALLYS